MHMVFAMEYWRSLFHDIMQKCPPFQYILIALLQSGVFLLTGETIENTQCMDTYYFIAYFSEICPFGHCALNFWVYHGKHFLFYWAHEFIEMFSA